MKVKVINMDVDTRRYLYFGLGIALILLGIISIYDYILVFFRLLLGITLICFGIYLLFIEKTYFRFKRFRF